MYVIQNRQKGEGFYCGILYHGEVGYYTSFFPNLNFKEVKKYDTKEQAKFDFYYLVDIWNVDLGFLEIVPVELVVKTDE
jgi:hypothetical protein